MFEKREGGVEGKVGGAVLFNKGVKLCGSVSR